MVLKLYGGADSTSTKRAAIVLYEKKIPFEFHAIDLYKGEHKSPAVIEKQPFGQVPYLDDDGFILYESRAIGRYIDEKYPDKGPKLIPTDLKKKALYEQAASIEVHNFSAYAAPTVFEIMYKEIVTGVPADQEKWNGFVKSLSSNLDVYEKILAKQKYLAGDEITIADLLHLPHGTLLTVVGCDAIETRPNVSRWFKGLTERESWQAIKDGVKSLSVDDPEARMVSLD